MQLDYRLVTPAQRGEHKRSRARDEASLIVPPFMLYGGCHDNCLNEGAVTMGGFFLEGELRSQLGDVLRLVGVQPSATMLDALCDRVAVSIHEYQKELGKLRPHAVRAELLSLLRLVQEPSAPVGQIRARVQALPDEVAARLDERAIFLAQRLLHHEMPFGGVREWSKAAPAKALLSFLADIIEEGGVPKPGRLRPDGTRRGGRLAPLIMGRAPGLHAASRGQTSIRVYHNGRPSDDDLLVLIGFLAVDWVQTTGLDVSSGRSDATAFGRLVHGVFGWLECGDKAQGALRRYWEMVRAGLDGVPEA